jgi:hydrogenase-4 component B
VTLVLLGIALVLAGGASAVLLRRRPALADRAFGLLVAGGATVGAAPAIRVLAGGGADAIAVAMPVPGGPWTFGIDSLSAFFLLVVFGVGAATAIYGLGYLGAERGHRPVAAAHLLTAVVLAALALVVTARAVVPFLIAWEGMAVLAYFLVVFERERAEVRRAGLIYLVATHTGTLALFAMFALWSRSTSALSFDALAAAAPSLPARGAAVLGLALLGFGLKAGLVPLHFWLPEAHGSAPSPVSALMSGVVIKMGIYGLLRVATLVAALPAWWGWLVLGLGLLSGVLGVLWALAQHDVKRLLAYHSVENIGIILLGLGAGALGVSYRLPAVAALGFAGAILHTLNHALFKSLLFFGAGAVQQATGTRALDRLGGLARSMPLTWLAFLVGSVAIVGLPPLNGFVSEWVVYQALLQSGATPLPAHLAVLGVAGLALVGGLALACFAKVDGVVFLGLPRSASAERGREAGPGMLGPMFALALACGAIGIAPALVVGPALAAGARVAGLPAGALGAAAAAVVRATQGIALLALALVALLALGWQAGGAWRRRRPVARAETWGCAYARPTPRMQYTASSFAAPLLATFGAVTGVQATRHGNAFHTRARELVLDAVALPLWAALERVARRLRALQQGRLWGYLLYLLAALLLLLLYLAAAGGATP